MPGIIAMAGFMGETGKTVAYSDTYVDSSSNLTTYTLPDFDVGAPASDRRIFGIIHWSEGGVHRSLSSVTLGGVSAAIHQQKGHSGGTTGLGVAIVSAVIPSGTTASCSITFSGICSGVAFSSIRTTGMTRSTPFDSDFDENQVTTADLTSSTNVDSKGLIIAAMTGSTNAVNDAVTWTGANEQYDLATAAGVHGSMAWQSGLAAETGRTILADITPRANSGNDLVVVSWS